MSGEDDLSLCDGEQALRERLSVAIDKPELVELAGWLHLPGERAD